MDGLWEAAFSAGRCDGSDQLLAAGADGMCVTAGTLDVGEVVERCGGEVHLFDDCCGRLDVVWGLLVGVLRVGTGGFAQDLADGSFADRGASAWLDDLDSTFRSWAFGFRVVHD